MGIKKTLTILSVAAIGFAGIYSLAKPRINSGTNSQLRAQNSSEIEKKIEKRIKEETDKPRSKTETLGDVLKYIEENPKKQETVINYIIDLRTKKKLPFSREIIDNLSKIVAKEVKKNPLQMKDYVLYISDIGLKSEYRNEILSKLTAKEKWEIFLEVSRAQIKGRIEDAKELTVDAYQKFKETKLYNRAAEAGKDIGKAGKNFYKKIKERIFK